MTDDLLLEYVDPLKPNRLKRVRDWSQDAEANTFQGIEKYKYNDRGNLIEETEKNVIVDWNFDDKVKQVVNPTGTTQFIYSPSGQRNAKIREETTDFWQGQYYVRDASDNVIAIYDFKKQKAGGFDELMRTEAYIYGSSRVGVDNQNVDLVNLPPNDVFARNRLQKSYELSNHLGNVYTVVSDGKRAVDENGALQYEPVVISTSDYFPFGQKISALSSTNDQGSMEKK